MIKNVFSDDDDALAKAVLPAQETGKKKKLINQFNYCERAVLTTNNPLRVLFIFITLDSKL